MAHAYLLVGPPHVGKLTLAMNLAQSVNCRRSPVEQSLPPDFKVLSCGSCAQCTRIAAGHHADVLVMGVGRGDVGGTARTVIGIDEVKAALQQASLKPYEGACRVIIFDGAEFMSEEAANAILKSLEEPPPQVIILLLTANEEALLSTIRSRCCRLLLRPTPKQQVLDRLVAEHRAGPEDAERLSRLSRGCLGWAIGALGDSQVLEQRQAELERILETGEAGLEERFGYVAELASLFVKDRESVRQLLYLWLDWWRDLMLIKEGAEEYIHNTEWLTPLRLQATGLTVAQIVGLVKRLLQTLEALDANANARLALETLMINLPRK